MDDEVWCIGIHGIGGVGKTTLASHIYNRLVRDDEKFGYRPYWVTVSQESSIGKLQNDIAKNLELDFSNEDKVGIPDKVNGHKTCKLILTTRSGDVCRRIGCQVTFKVQPLYKKEAWKLFEENLGQQTELSPEVRDIAMHVAAKCAGLPLAIITMAGSMREMHDLIRDMALKITKAGHPRFMVKAGVGLKDIPAECEWTEDLDMVSLMDNCIEEIPHGRSPRLGESHYIEASRLYESHTYVPPLGKLRALQELDLSFTHIKEVPEGVDRLHALHVLDLSMNQDLEKLPNSISDLENLTALKLRGCRRLTYVPPLGKLRALQELNLRFTHIKEVPEDLENLTTLKLQGCMSLTYVPPLGKLRALQELDLSFTHIKEVPEGVDRLHALHVLDLSENSYLGKLPNSISDLENLTALKLRGCRRLTYVPPLGKLRALQELNLRFTHSKENLENLTTLKLQGCRRLTYVPPLGKLRALQELDLSFTRIKEVPEGVDRLHALHVLDLSMNRDLEKLPNSISDLENLTALKLQFCTSLTYVPPLGKLRALQELDLRCTHIKEVPEGVDRLHALHVLDLSMNQDLEKLPNSISDLENLTALKLQFCTSLTYVPPLGKLRALQELDLSCTHIKEVPEGVDRLVNLKILNMEGTERLERLPSGIILGKLSYLQRLGQCNSPYSL
ncbi:hypothetical protein Acr_17g0003720 [Actinidia rufa]|uniref:NB-ARC domain-containing protein n=1 Tax=Actinidia rufa TaxID=165716 RepID=A0A7J0G1Y9_9ERIC|nr:hypothetical protein Acr_17g0003720 [Actinidia rufa]